MITIIYTLPINEARSSYPPETEIVATSEHWRGYYNQTTYVSDLQEARVWKLNETTYWGRHVVANIISRGLTQEEIDKMTPGQRLVYEIQSAPVKQEGQGDCSKEKALETVKALMKTIGEPTRITVLNACLLIGVGEFREKFMSQDEITQMDAILGRVVEHYSLNPARTPSNLVVDAIFQLIANAQF
jgi:hypothetical protein